MIMSQKLLRFPGSPRFIKTLLTAFALSCVAILVIGNSWEARSLQAERAASEEFLSEASDLIAAELQREIMAVELLSLLVAAGIQRQPDLTQQDFADLVGPLIDSDASIRYVGLKRDFVVTNVFPGDSSEAIVGLDYSDVPARAEMIQQVLDSGDSFFTGPVELTEGGLAFVQSTPVFVSDSAAEPGPAWGVLSVVIDRDEMLALAGLSNEASPFRAALRNIDYPGSRVGVLWGDPEVFRDWPVLQNVDLAGGIWQVGITPENGWPTVPSNAAMIWTVTTIGTLLCALMVLGVSSIRGSERRIRGQLKSAIEAIDDGFIIYDADDRMVYANERFRSYFHLSRDLIVPGNSYDEILREAIARGQFKDAIGREEDWFAERKAEHVNPTGPSEFHLADGRWVQVSETKTPEGNTVGLRVDITDMKLAQERAEAANRARQNFLGVISHELRTPLTAIIGYTKFIENAGLLPSYAGLEVATEANPEHRAALDAFITDLEAMASRIGHSSERLLSLINDILDSTKIDSHTFSFDMSDVDVGDLVKYTVAVMQTAADRKGLDLSGLAEPIAIKGDRLRLRQALLNIVDNAIKYTDEGKVEVWTESDPEKVWICVRDTGRGIHVEDQARIFDSFTQIDASAARRGPGLGLGLTIAREIIENHGGSIELESVHDQGSLFRIMLPRCQASQKDVA